MNNTDLDSYKMVVAASLRSTKIRHLPQTPASAIKISTRNRKIRDKWRNFVTSLKHFHTAHLRNTFRCPTLDIHVWAYECQNASPANGFTSSAHSQKVNVRRIESTRSTSGASIVVSGSSRSSLNRPPQVCLFQCPTKLEPNHMEKRQATRWMSEWQPSAIMPRGKLWVKHCRASLQYIAVFSRKRSQDTGIYSCHRRFAITLMEFTIL